MKHGKLKRRADPDVVTRRLEWPQCKVCQLPTRTLHAGVCVQCHFVEIVRTERRDYGQVIDSLREHGLCAYCGEYASDIEHVIARRTRLPTMTVPACRECNSIAGGEWFTSMHEKTEYIHRGIRDKYAKVLASPEWDDEEIREMGRAMRDMIKAWRVARLVTLQRLAWNPLNRFLEDD